MQGFVLTSRGLKITDKLKTIVSCIALVIGVVMLFVSLFEKSVLLAVITIITYFVVPGVGQTLTLALMKETKRISTFHGL